MIQSVTRIVFFFFNDTATTEIYTLSLHDALPISPTVAVTADSKPKRSAGNHAAAILRVPMKVTVAPRPTAKRPTKRSEEHTSELQSRLHLVCRLLLEKKKNMKT